MRTKDIQPILKRILETLPGFVAKGVMIIASPINEILRGFYFEDSGFDKRVFYVWAFVQPLYVPDVTVSFYLGKCLGGGSGERWRLDQMNLADEVLSSIKSEGLPWIEAGSTPLALCSWVESLPNRKDPYVRQARAYSLASAHRFDEAKGALHNLVLSLDIKVPWMVQMRDRAIKLSDLVESGASDVDAQLLEWKNETARHLRLNDL